MTTASIQGIHPNSPVWRVEVGNVPNLMVGSGMQQAHDGLAEETAEVVRDHVGGTGSARVAPN